MGRVGALRDKLVNAGTAIHYRTAGALCRGDREQASLFFLDPSGNAIEFKAFKDPAKLFAKAWVPRYG